MSPCSERRRIFRTEKRFFRVETVEFFKIVKCVVYSGDIHECPRAAFAECGILVHGSGEKARAVKPLYCGGKPPVYISALRKFRYRFLVEQGVHHDGRVVSVTPYHVFDVSDVLLSRFKIPVFVDHEYSETVAFVKKLRRWVVVNASEAVYSKLLQLFHAVCNDRIRNGSSYPCMTLMTAHAIELYVFSV